MLSRRCLLLSAVPVLLLILTGREESRAPELSASTTCGYLEERHGLRPGQMLGIRKLQRCLAAGRGAEVWLAEPPSAVKILKFTDDQERLREECVAFERLRLDGVASVPRCSETGLMPTKEKPLAFSARELVPGRRLFDLIEEAKVRMPPQLSQLRTVFRAVLSIFQVMDSGVRSCLPGSTRDCRYHVEVSAYNAMITDDGRAFVVDFDSLGPSRYLTYFGQTALFSPFVSLDERLKECLTRSLILTLLMSLMAGAEARTWVPHEIVQLGIDLTWRGSKLDHCRTSSLTESELEQRRLGEVSWNWRWDGTATSAQRRAQGGVEADLVQMVLSLMHPGYAEDWARLPRASEVLLDALIAVRTWDISWPPRFIGPMQRWLEILDGEGTAGAPAER